MSRVKKWGVVAGGVVMGVAALSLLSPYKIQWEGPFVDQNFRDVGASLNECLGQELFNPGVLTRSNKFFSGFLCSGIGSPDEIYSLNNDPNSSTKYFCLSGWDAVNKGKYFNDTKKIPALDEIKYWDDADTRVDACKFLSAAVSDIANSRKIHIHCDAGRDRTGTLSALLSWSLAQSAGVTSDELLQAVSCDYKKSASLSQKKYGRMIKLIKKISNRSTDQNILVNLCGIEDSKVKKAAEKFVHGKPTTVGEAFPSQ